MPCPSKKKCHRTAEDAQPYLESLQPEDHPSRAKRLGIYRCNRCGWLHVGHDYGPVKHRTQRRGKHARVHQPPTLEHALSEILQDLLDE